VSTREQTRAYYDQNVPVYDLKTGFDRDSGQTYNLERYYAPFLEASLPTSGRVLELGCGTGFYTRWLTERGVDVVAMDISPKMVEQARSRCPESASFAVGDCQDPAATLGMERVGGGFDVVFGVNTFSYYPEKRRALLNYRELLRKDGRMVMLDVNGNAFSQRLAYLVNLRGARIFAENINENTAENLRPLLQETGFEVETMTRFTFMPNAMNRIGVLLWSPFERVLAHLPLLNAIAIRIAWTARKVER
jgi:SAM-dependent methyltransferase